MSFTTEGKVHLQCGCIFNSYLLCYYWVNLYCCRSLINNTVTSGPIKASKHHPILPGILTIFFAPLHGMNYKTLWIQTPSNEGFQRSVWLYSNCRPLNVVPVFGRTAAALSDVNVDCVALLIWWWRWWSFVCSVLLSVCNVAPCVSCCSYSNFWQCHKNVAYVEIRTLEHAGQISERKHAAQTLLL